MHETQTPSVRPNLVVNALELGFAAYERTHALPHYVIQAVRLILLCRTAALGGACRGLSEWVCAAHPL